MSVTVVAALLCLALIALVTYIAHSCARAVAADWHSLKRREQAIRERQASPTAPADPTSPEPQRDSGPERG